MKLDSLWYLLPLKFSAAWVTCSDLLASSSAVAKRPCDALCLSVVSFSSSLQYHEHSFFSTVTLPFDLPLHTVWFSAVVSSITSSLAVIHSIHGRLWLCIVRDRAWSVSHCAYNTWHIPALQSTKTRLLNAINWPWCSSYRWQSQIYVENQDFSLPHLRSTPPLGGWSPVGILPRRLVWKN